MPSQNYFRETSCIPQLTPLLLFPPSNLIADTESPEAIQALDAFAFQQWEQQKTINAQMVLHLVRTLMTGAGEGRAQNQVSLLFISLAASRIRLMILNVRPARITSCWYDALSGGNGTSVFRTCHFEDARPEHARRYPRLLSAQPGFFIFTFSDAPHPHFRSSGPVKAI